MNKELPKNLHITWHTGDISFCEINSRPIINGFVSGNIKIEKIIRASDYESQLSEGVFKSLFNYAIGIASCTPDKIYQYIRMDNSKRVEENTNNQPFKVSEGCIKNINIYGYKLKLTL